MNQKVMLVEKERFLLNDNCKYMITGRVSKEADIECYLDGIRLPSCLLYTSCTAGDEVPGMISTKKLISGVPKENNVDLNFGYVDYTTKVVPRWNSQEGYTPAKQPLYSDPKLHKNGWTTVKEMCIRDRLCTWN